ncbi:MAG: TolC family protein [Tenuifilaceae bacterium]|nr:TolC family protein [Tenuifilaceae bacterium]
MKQRLLTFAPLLLLYFSGMGQQQVSLEQCRQMALEHNQRIKIAAEQTGAADALQKSAKTQFFPSISANGLYTRTNKKYSLLSEDMFIPVVPFSAIDPTTGQLNGSILDPQSPNFDPSVFTNTFQLNPATGQPLYDKDGNPVFQKYAWIPKDKAEFGAKNIFAAGVGLTQPIYLGGKIRETYKMAGYGKRAAQASERVEQSEVLYQTEESYWRLVSLKEKVTLVKSYVALLEKLNGDLDNLYAEGIIIQNDKLKATVKLNEAQLNLVKAENGYRLSQMALCQVVGLPLSTMVEPTDTLGVAIPLQGTDALIDSALLNRPEIDMLDQTVNIAQSGVNIMRSRYLPNIGLTANYMYMNPNPYNGMKEEFGGDWNVGVAINIPIFHWNDRAHTLRAAKHEHAVAQLKKEEATELITLQVQQAMFKVSESAKRIEMAQENLKKATENLRVATDAFDSGMLKATDVLEAQALWQEAYSTLIDARMEARLNEVFLRKATGVKLK